jgi:hypothetical protein
MDVSTSAAGTITIPVESRGHPLVVCCAAEEGPELAPAFDLLRARGFEISLLDNAAMSTPAMVEQVRRHGPRAIFVLVQRANLETASRAPLEQVLRSMRVLPERIVEVVTDWRNPLALVEQLQDIEPDPPPSMVEVPQIAPVHVSAQVPTKPLIGGPPPPPAPSVERPPAPTPSIELPTPPFPRLGAAFPGALPASPSHIHFQPPGETSGIPERVDQSLHSAPGGVRRILPLTSSFRPIVVATRRRLRHTTPRTRMLAGGGLGAIALAGVLVWAAGDDDAPSESSGVALAQANILAPSPQLDEDTHPPDPSRDDEIARALAQGQLGSHEGIVYAPLESSKSDFDGAAAMCEEMNDGPIPGWRMPGLGEIHTLAAAQVIGRGVYWSGTEVDAFDGRAFIWSEKNTRAVPIGKRWTGARALCVLDVLEQ